MYFIKQITLAYFSYFCITHSLTHYTTTTNNNQFVLPQKHIYIQQYKHIYIHKHKTTNKYYIRQVLSNILHCKSPSIIIRYILDLHLFQKKITILRTKLVPKSQTYTFITIIYPQVLTVKNHPFKIR